MIGQTLAHYRITAAIGAGGMGEVYRATDTTLHREVAIKVLPPEVAQDPERLSRFRREAQLLAALNHPNIGAIYGLEEADGRLFLALELVEGEGLDQRLARGAIPVAEALDLARQIAEALEEAHEKGIVHRDLKPANVKLTPDDKAKVLDFGLAKAWAGDPPTGSSSDLSQSPTLAHTGTQAGVILGTAAYMSPEQARGKPVDARSDIWAFGVVLFEMLTGRRLFEGETVSDVLASILKEEPPWDALPEGVSPGVARALRRCLQRSPRERFHHIADVRIELGEAREAQTSESTAPVAAPRRQRLRSGLPWAVALAAMAFAAWAGLGTIGDAVDHPPVVAAIPPPPGAEFLVERGFALSPDGRQLVFAAREGEGPGELWLRALGNSVARKLAGTEEGNAPFWSPDGRHVGFFAAGKVKRIDLETGLVENVTDYSGLGESGAAWSPHGDIVLCSWEKKTCERVPARGGTPAPLSPVAVHVERAWPAFLPDGRRFLYLARDYSDAAPLRQLCVGSLDGDLDREIMPVNSNALYAPSGHLVWWQDGNLRAQRLDTERLTALGESRVLAAGVQFNPTTGLGAFSLSGTTLVYREGGLLLGDELVRLSRSGEELGPVGPPGNYYRPRLSPDGSRIAVDRSDETNRGDIWIYQIERGTGTRLSTAPEDETAPVWSPDGNRIAYWAALGEGNVIRILDTEGGEREDDFAIDGPQSRPSAWSAGGVLFVDRQGDIWIWTLEDRSFTPFLETPFKEGNAVASPDGRFVAYDSDETGRQEVYVRTFPDSGRRWTVSTDGGHSPAWRRDGGEIYYVDTEERLTAVTVRPSTNAGTQGDLRLGSPRALFHVELKKDAPRQYDTLDGQTFVVNRTRRTGSRSPLTLVLNVDFDERERRGE